jgi:S-(hydroxymethyl)glutathione dehydrogenase/alcohol dehydrogenase
VTITGFSLTKNNFMSSKFFTTRAAVLESLGEPLKIRTIEIPELKRGQVLVKVLFSGVCRSQLMEVRGFRGADPWLPHLLGHEGSGTVISIGEGVTKVAVGDDVILGWVKGEGLDPLGAQYKLGKRTINSGRVTTFANITVVSESRLVRKPQDLAFDEAILFGCALPTGAGMVLNELKPAPNTSVVVLGLGGIGLSALLALKALGVAPIIAIDISDIKLDFAKQLGADYIFNSSKEDVRDAIISLTNGGADYCVESGGLISTIELGFSLVRKGGGKLIFASHPSQGEKITLDPHELISGKRIYGSWGGGSKPDEDIPKLHSLLAGSNFSLANLITKRYKLEEINEALYDLECGRVFRPLIVMDHHEDTKESG